jgi:hypothetical protein
MIWAMILYSLMRRWCTRLPAAQARRRATKESGKQTLRNCRRSLLQMQHGRCDATFSQCSDGANRSFTGGRR